MEVISRLKTWGFPPCDSLRILYAKSITRIQGAFTHLTSEKLIRTLMTKILKKIAMWSCFTWDVFLKSMPKNKGVERIVPHHQPEQPCFCPVCAFEAVFSRGISPSMVISWRIISNDLVVSSLVVFPLFQQSLWRLSSGNLTVCYWKWHVYFVDLPFKDCDFP